MPRHLAELVLFGRGNRLLGRAKSLTSTGLYLHKDENILVLGDDVNLTERTAIVPADNAVPQAFQVKESKVLTFVALKQIGFGPMSRLFTVLIYDDCFNILRLPRIRSISY